MRRLQQTVALLGVLCLAAGLVCATISFGPAPLPRILIVAGMLLLATWPVRAPCGPRGRRFSAAPTVVGSILVLVVLIAVNVLASRHALRWDTTRTARFTLSPQTRQVLTTLAEPVEALAFTRGEEREVRDLLKEYAAASRRFSFRVVDPDRRPEEAQAYDIRDYGTVILSSGTRRERVTTPSEQDLTAALMRLQENRRMTVHFLIGHGERLTSDESKVGVSKLAHAMRLENYDIAERLLLRDGLPDRADLLVMPGPTAALLPAELDSLDRFVEEGGRLLLMLEPGGPALPGVLARRGITARSDVIVDASGVGSIFGMSEVVPLVARYDVDHPITKGFATATFFPLCRSLSVAKPAEDSSEVACLAFTSEASWGETGDLTGGKVSFDAGEEGGPLCVGAAASWVREATGDTLKAQGRVVVFGDVDFVANAYLDVSGNRDLCLNALSWLAERGALISIRPREGGSASLTLSADAARSIFLLVVIVLPAAVLAAGIAVRVRRR